MTETLASDADIAELAETLGANDDGDLAAVDALLARHSADPRLHFMKGSILAGRGEAIPAHRAMSRAVELSPSFTLARYQLGFFELTSGEPDRALATWGPLLRLGEDAYLRRFVEGMTHLVRDEFDAAIADFEAGTALNTENPPMNADVRLLVDQCRTLRNAAPAQTRSGEDEEEELSATALLLGQFGSGTLQ